MRTDLLLADFQRALRVLLPASWQLTRTTRKPPHVLQVSGYASVATTLLVKASDTPEVEDLPEVIMTLRQLTESRDASHALLALPFVPPAVRPRLRFAGINWFDPTGNIFLHLDEPVLHLDRMGADISPYGDAVDGPYAYSTKP